MSVGVSHSLDITTSFIFAYSKPLNYAIALNELGADTVHSYVGTEPTGGKFNALELDYRKKPHNPMVNSGSIVVNALLQNLMKPEMSGAEKFDYINDYIKVRNSRRDGCTQYFMGRGRGRSGYGYLITNDYEEVSVRRGLLQEVLARKVDRPIHFDTVRTACVVHAR